MNEKDYGEKIDTIFDISLIQKDKTYQIMEKVESLDQKVYSLDHRVFKLEHHSN